MHHHLLIIPSIIFLPRINATTAIINTLISLTSLALKWRLKYGIIILWRNNRTFLSYLLLTSVMRILWSCMLIYFELTLILAAVVVKRKTVVIAAIFISINVGIRVDASVMDVSHAYLVIIAISVIIINYTCMCYSWSFITIRYLVIYTIVIISTRISYICSTTIIIVIVNKLSIFSSFIVQNRQLNLFLLY